jgi:hypothetical protein
MAVCVGRPLNSEVRSQKSSCALGVGRLKLNVDCLSLQVQQLAVLNLHRADSLGWFGNEPELYPPRQTCLQPVLF